jgi:hypothetical protein
LSLAVAEMTKTNKRIDLVEAELKRVIAKNSQLNNKLVTYKDQLATFELGQQEEGKALDYSQTESLQLLIQTTEKAISDNETTIGNLRQEIIANNRLATAVVIKKQGSETSALK